MEDEGMRHALTPEGWEHLPTRISNALQKAGFETPAEAGEKTNAELLLEQGVGMKGLADLRTFLSVEDQWENTIETQEETTDDEDEMSFTKNMVPGDTAARLQGIGSGGRLNDYDFTTTAYPEFSEIRLLEGGGGPGGMEAIFKCDLKGARIAIFNPYRHEWATVDLTGRGDTRRSAPVEEKAPVEENHSGSDFQCRHGEDLNSPCDKCDLEAMADGMSLAEEAAAPLEEAVADGGPETSEDAPVADSGLLQDASRDLPEDFPETAEVKADEELFNEFSSISNHIRALRSVVQNDMEVTRDEVEEWNQLAQEIQDRLEKVRGRVIDHLMSCE